MSARLSACPQRCRESHRGHGRSYLRVPLEGFRCYQDGVDKAWVHTSLRSLEKGDTQVVDIRVYDEMEWPVPDFDGLAVRLLPFAKLHSSQASTDDGFYRVAWRKSDRDTFRTVHIEACQAGSSSPMRKVSARWPTG